MLTLMDTNKTSKKIYKIIMKLITILRLFVNDSIKYSMKSDYFCSG